LQVPALKIGLWLYSLFIQNDDGATV
jgi:hypothetical protein